MKGTNSKMPGKEKTPSSILIVDDQPENLRIMNTFLSEAGFQVRSAISGQAAINSAQANLPDLILLDIEMPFMNGFETCKSLKSDSRTKDVPIIFVSGSCNCIEKVKGLKAGAVDYITKPFQFDELLARVEIHLKLTSLQAQLKEKNEVLENTLRQKDEIEKIIFHDIRGPLSPILSLPKSIKRHQDMDERCKKYLRIIEKAGMRILNLVNSSNMLHRMENQNNFRDLKPVDLAKIIDHIISGIPEDLVRIDIKIQVLIDGNELKSSDSFIVNGEEELCYTMLENILRNAFEASKANQTITIALKHGPQMIVEVHNEEPVSKEIRSSFFKKYATHGKTKGTGLGTYSAKLAAEIQGAEISMTTSESTGTCIRITFPADTPTIGLIENHSQDCNQLPV